jgi:hypothetical protein
VEAIARILLERGDPHMTREAIRSTARDAQNFHRR